MCTKDLFCTEMIMLLTMYWYWNTIRQTKCTFFDEKIHEIASTNKCPWDLMNWVKRKPLPASEAIKFDNQSYTSLESLWVALHSTYNSATNRQINLDLLNEIPICPPVKWPPFSKAEIREAIAKCKNLSVPGPDHISWKTLKLITSDDVCLSHIVQLANSCINLSYWPSLFKDSTSVIIPKPQKPSYDTPKSFCPIILLNTLGKLIEKAISCWLQHHTIRNNYLHPNQLGSIQQRSTTDAGIYLFHLVRAGWTKGLHTSVIAFYIAQFFPSLNHDILTSCITKAGFGPNISLFFANYLKDHHTRYC